MGLKRVQTAQSKSPIPGWRGKQHIAAGKSRFYAGNGSTVVTDSTADDTHSTLETLDTYSGFDGPTSSAASNRDAEAANDQYYDDGEGWDDESQHESDDTHGSRERSVTVMDEREGSISSHTVTNTAREGSQTIQPQSVKPKSSDTNASTFTHVDQGPRSVVQSDENADPEDMDFTDKARLTSYGAGLVWLTLFPDNCCTFFTRVLPSSACPLVAFSSS